MSSKPIEVESRTHTWSRLIAAKDAANAAPKSVPERGKRFFKAKGTVPFGWFKGIEPVKLFRCWG